MMSQGQKLLHYRLEEKIGQGGMGEVWKATDTRLDREVALKFLPSSLAGDSERIDRFRREAKFLASLNDPGIATLHDLVEHEDHRFLVMELVPGQDLSEVLEAGPLSLDEALDVALQTARALEVAHGQGVVHRDLKPANIKRTPDGKVKVLDFGLAKVFAPDSISGDRDLSLSPTLTSAGTVAGTILGTASYMSPEQARGRTIDKRSDIWSFGVLLYELLTGDNPFKGETVADSVGAILHRDPNLDALPPETPRQIRRLLRRCIQRKRAHRLHDIADVRIELEEAMVRPELDASAAPSEVKTSRRLPSILIALALPIVALGSWWIGAREVPAPPPPLRQFELATDLEVDEVAISPDGTRLAYRVGGEIFVRALDSLEPRRVIGETDPNMDRRWLFWSPDGRSLGFVVRGVEIHRIDLDGTSPTILALVDGFASFPSWGEDGYIYFAGLQSGLYRVRDSGGAPEPYLERDENMIDYHGMARLPGGAGFLTAPHLQSGEPQAIYLERPGEERRTVYESDGIVNTLVFSATGHILFQREENPTGLWALPFSLDRLEATGPPFLVIPDLSSASVSDDGQMVYAESQTHSARREQELVWVDRSGAVVDRLDLALYGARVVGVSPDGSRLALIAKGVGRPSTGKHNLWVIDLERQSSLKLTEGGLVQSAVTWSQDSSRIAFLMPSEKPGGQDRLVALRADGTGELETLVAADVTFLATLNPDWSLAAFMTGQVSDDKGMAIDVQAPGEPASRFRLVDGSDHEVAPSIHPNGTWIAYLSTDFSSSATMVRRFPEGERRWKVSLDEGGFPFWSSDGKKLYYVPMSGNGTDMRLVEVAFDGSGSEPVIGTPVELFVSEEVVNDRFGVGPEDRFHFVRNVESPDGGEPIDTQGIVLIENWLTRFAE